MAARTRRTTLNDTWRERIRTSMLVNRLQEHVLSKVTMSVTQLRAAEILPRKTLPDLSHAEVETTTHRTLDDIIRESYKYDAELNDSLAEPPDAVHY